MQSRFRQAETGFCGERSVWGQSGPFGVKSKLFDTCRGACHQHTQSRHLLAQKRKPFLESLRTRGATANTRGACDGFALSSRRSAMLLKDGGSSERGCVFLFQSCPRTKLSNPIPLSFGRRSARDPFSSRWHPGPTLSPV